MPGLGSRRVLGALSLLAVACSGPHEEAAGSSEAAHTEGELTWSNAPYSWLKLSQEELEKTIGEKAAPKTHPIAERLQAWVDRLDTEVRKVVKERTGKELVAPRPQVRLVVSGAVNAWIQPLPTCFASVTKPAAGSASIVVFTAPNDSARMEDDYCFEPMGWPASEQRLQWLNQLNAANPRAGQAPMAVKLEPNAIVLSSGAKDAETRAAKLAGISSTSLVNVNVGLVSELDEKSAAVMLAHELAHYYRAHGTTATGNQYRFWFDRDRALPERPVPVENQLEYQTKYEQLKVPRFLVAGQTFHPRLGLSLVAWAKQLKVASGHACEPVAKAVAKWSPAIRFELGSESGRDLSGAARRAYLDLEKPLASCFEALKLTNDVVDPADTTPFSSAAVPREWFQLRLREPLTKAGTDAEFGATKTVSELVEFLTKKAKELDAEAPAFLQRLEKNQIGLYTEEQEADDISFELATRLGLTRDDVYGSQIKVMRWAENVSSEPVFDEANTSMSAAECESLLAKGFKVGGKDVHVPLGTLKNPHHAYCYRLFNLYRENEAHKYVPAAPSFPTGGPAWTDLQTQARDLLAGGPGEGAQPTQPTGPEGTPTPSPSGSGSSSAGPPPGDGYGDYPGDGYQGDGYEYDPEGEGSAGGSSKKKGASAGCSTVFHESGAGAGAGAGVSAALIAGLIAFRRRRRS